MFRSRARPGMLLVLLAASCAGCGALVHPSAPGIPAAALRLPPRVDGQLSHVPAAKVMLCRKSVYLCERVYVVA